MNALLEPFCEVRNSEASSGNILFFVANRALTTPAIVHVLGCSVQIPRVYVGMTIIV